MFLPSDLMVPVLWFTDLMSHSHSDYRHFHCYTSKPVGGGILLSAFQTTSKT